MKVGIEVAVEEKPSVLLVKIDPATATVALGAKQALHAQVTLADGQINGNVVWSSSDDGIATVNPTTGDLLALREGKVTIVASYAPDSRYKGLAEITVAKTVPMSPTPTAPSTPPTRP